MTEAAVVASSLLMEAIQINLALIKETWEFITQNNLIPTIKIKIKLIIYGISRY